MSTRLKGMGSQVAIPLLLLALSLYFYWPIITPEVQQRGSFPPGDFAMPNYAYRYYATEELVNGRLPLWTNYANAGHPFLADPLTAVLYPPNLLLALVLFLAGRHPLPLLALEGMAVLHVYLASLFLYAFARHITASRFAGLIAAIAFAYSGYLTTYPPLQLTILQVVPWMPLILLFLTLAMESRGNPAGQVAPRGRPYYWVAAALALAMSSLAGHPQQSLQLHYAVGIYGLSLAAYKAWEGCRKREPSCRFGSFVAGLMRSWLMLAAVFLLGFAVAAAQWLPTLEFAGLSSRAQVSYDFVQGGFAWAATLGFILPEVGAKPMYIGLISLILIGLALATASRLRRLAKVREPGVVLWATMAAFAFLLSFGGKTPLFNLLYRVAPGFDLFRSQERWVFITSFSLAILAGYGARYAVSTPLEELRLRLPFGARQSVWPWYRAALMLAIGSLLVADLFATNRYNNVSSAIETDFFSRTPVVDFLRERASAVYRIEVEDGLPGYGGLVYRLPFTRATGPMMNRYYATAQEALMGGTLAQLLNIEFVVARRDLSAELERVFAWGGTHVYRVANPLPRVFPTYRALVIPDDEEALALLASPAFVVGRAALLSEAPEIALKGRGFARTVRVAYEGPTNIVVEAETNAPALLVFCDAYYPGWRAFVDGREVRIYRAYYLLRAIELPAGPHLVQMIYDPLSVKAGAVVSLLALALALALLLGSISGALMTRRVAIWAFIAVMAVSGSVWAWRSLTPDLVQPTPAHWEAMATYVGAMARPGDALILPEGAPPFLTALPEWLAVHRGPLSEELVVRHPRLWAVTEAGNGPEDWLRERAQKTEDRWFGGLYLGLYEPDSVVLKRIQHPLTAVLGQQIELLGYDLSPAASPFGDTTYRARPGDVLTITLYWRALKEMETNYTVFLQLLDSAGLLVAQRDSPPQDGGRPTEGWLPSEIIADRHLLTVPEGLPSGNYALIAGLYDAATGQRLLLAGGDHVVLGQVVVSRSALP